MEVEFVASFSRHFPPLIISPSILSFSHPSYAMPSSFYRELDRQLLFRPTRLVKHPYPRFIAVPSHNLHSRNVRITRYTSSIFHPHSPREGSSPFPLPGRDPLRALQMQGSLNYSTSNCLHISYFGNYVYGFDIFELYNRGGKVENLWLVYRTVLDIRTYEYTERMYAYIVCDVHILEYIGELKTHA